MDFRLSSPNYTSFSTIFFTWSFWTHKLLFLGQREIVNSVPGPKQKQRPNTVAVVDMIAKLDFSDRNQFRAAEFSMDHEIQFVSHPTQPTWPAILLFYTAQGIVLV